MTNWQDLTEQQKLDVVIDLRTKLAECEEEISRIMHLLDAGKATLEHKERQIDQANADWASIRQQLAKSESLRDDWESKYHTEVGWHIKTANKLAECEKDAARYRWITAEYCGCPFAETDDAWNSKETLDTAIDAAMKESK